MKYKLIIILILLYYLFYYRKELFSTLDSELKNNCKCDILDRHECSFCRNCVFCKDNNKCVYGNINGPIENCANWEYNFYYK